MFKGIASRWREARAPVLQKEILDILNRYTRWGDYERYECLSAFDYVKSDLEDENGPIEQWSDSFAKQVRVELMQTAKQGYSTSPYGASGAALLSLLVELQHIPGSLAEELRMAISDWHETAMMRDMPSRKD